MVCGGWTENARWCDGHSAGCDRESLAERLEGITTNGGPRSPTNNATHQARTH
jgi:hypothetical protein